MLRQVDLIAAQNDETAERFRALGARPESVHTTGSIKFDGAQTRRDKIGDWWVYLFAAAGLIYAGQIFLRGTL